MPCGRWDFYIILLYSAKIIVLKTQPGNSKITQLQEPPPQLQEQPQLESLLL